MAKGHQMKQNSLIFLIEVVAGMEIVKNAIRS